MNDNKLFSVSFDKEINHFTSEVENQVYLRVYTTMFTSGLVADMKLHNFATLMAIASYMNEDGECFPTQQQLAERMGVHINSVNKYVNQLLDFKVDGKPIITREIVNQGRGRVSSYYKIHPISQLAIFNGGVESITNDVSHNLGSMDNKKCDVTKDNKQKPSIKRYTPKELITIFVNKYREVYGVSFNPSWGRDMALMKKLQARYDDETLVQILEIAIEDYNEKWKSVKFPRPTIGAVSSFIADQAQAIIEERKKEDEEFEAFEQASESRSEKLHDKLSKLDRL